MVHFNVNIIIGHFLWDAKISSIPEKKNKNNLNVIQNCGKDTVSPITPQRMMVKMILT